MTYGSSPFGGAPLGAAHDAVGSPVIPPAVTGQGIADLSLTAAGTAIHSGTVPGVSGIGAGIIDCATSGAGGHGVAGVAVAAIHWTASGIAAHGVSGAAVEAILIASAGVAIHERYELRGEVREGGVLVNRRVRAYLRSTGALVGEADTVVGKFNVNAGFSQAEHYVIPIDLGEFASDWLPPAANRIVPVLAYDLA